MGLLNKLLGGAEGCREAMRDSYRQHVAAARQRGIADVHHVGLYGALGSRYRARGIPVDEHSLMAELAPFLLMTPANAILALPEYACFIERHSGANVERLNLALNSAILNATDQDLLQLVRLGFDNRAPWSELVTPANEARLPLPPRGAPHAARPTEDARDDSDEHEREDEYDGQGESAAEKENYWEIDDYASELHAQMMVMGCGVWEYQSKEEQLGIELLYPPSLCKISVNIGKRQGVPPDAAAAFVMIFVSSQAEAGNGRIAAMLPITPDTRAKYDAITTDCMEYINRNNHVGRLAKFMVALTEETMR